MLEKSRNSETQAPREWFVLHEERYRGPYFLGQIREQLEQGTLSPITLAWREGMTDWAPLGEISQFRIASTLGLGADFVDSEFSGATTATWDASLDDDLWVQDPGIEIEAQRKEAVRAQTQKTTNAKSGSKSDADVSTDAELQAVENAAMLGASREWNEKSWSELAQHNDEYDLAPGTSLPRTVYVDPATLGLVSKKPLFSTRNLLVGGIVLILLVSFSVVMMNRARKETFERLVDVSREENRQLLATVSESLSRQGPTAALAMSQSDPTAPFFYAATNLPDGSRFEIHIDGVQDTLLERLAVSVRTLAIAKDGLARSPQFRQENGKPYPRGEYKISVICAACAGVAPGAMLAQKTYFLGGLRDREYDQKLKVFHEQVRQSAQVELIEVRQLADTLEGQLNDTNVQFQRVIAVLHRNKAVPWPGVTWPVFHPRWLQLQEQIDTLAKEWTPEEIQKNFFFADFYTSLKQTNDLVKRVHTDQTDYLFAKREDGSVEAKTELDAQAARTALQVLRAKTTAAMKLPPSANGMPQRPSAN